MERDEQTFAIIGAAMEVHRELGHGFLEAVYHETLGKEFAARQISFRREVALVINYKGEPLLCGYRADFLCYESVVVEIKAIQQLTRIERAQVINELKATGFERALLINFGAPSLEHERIVLTSENLRKSAKSAVPSEAIYL
jgi:GxxExxY protein